MLIRKFFNSPNSLTPVVRSKGIKAYLIVVFRNCTQFMHLQGDLIRFQEQILHICYHLSLTPAGCVLRMKYTIKKVLIFHLNPHPFGRILWVGYKNYSQNLIQRYRNPKNGVGTYSLSIGRNPLWWPSEGRVEKLILDRIQKPEKPMNRPNLEFDFSAFLPPPPPPPNFRTTPRGR